MIRIVKKITKKIAITGNIAAGKTCVEEILQKYGYNVFDLDKICADLYLNDEQIKKQIFDEFNTLDKKKIAQIIFSDYIKRKALENIIHPKLKEIILELFKEKEQQNIEFIFISGALIYEAGFDKLFDKIIFIDAPYEMRLKRLIKRNNLEEIEAKKRLDNQNDKTKSRADFIIENNTDLYELEFKIIKALKLL